MSLDKAAILYGKEKRKQYRKSKLIDHSCRNHGSCHYCKMNRLYKFIKHFEETKDIKYEINEVVNDNFWSLV